MASIEHILCPVDFSPGSERVVDYAATLAKLAGASVELLHVYHVPLHATPEGEVKDIPEHMASLLARAQDALDALREPLAARGISVATRLLEGEVTESILRCAGETGASLLVLGTHGRGGFKQFVLGSVAERVVRTASLPVLTVHLAA